jgi:hypothetical protein
MLMLMNLCYFLPYKIVVKDEKLYSNKNGVFQSAEVILHKRNILLIDYGEQIPQIFKTLGAVIDITFTIFVP